MADEFTMPQVRDLVAYFLGSGWSAELLPGGVQPFLLRLDTGSIYGISYQGRSWREVFRSAGVVLPSRSQYVAEGLRVMMRTHAVCTAVSNTMAKRIAAALNNHTPDRRGI